VGHFLEVGVPPGSGGLVKALRKDGMTAPGILMSGYAAEKVRAGMKEAGVLAWLDKPATAPGCWRLRWRRRSAGVTPVACCLTYEPDMTAL
jgi:hypothetical protein